VAGMVGDSVIEYWLKLTKKNEKQKYRILYYYSIDTWNVSVCF